MTRSRPASRVAHSAPPATRSVAATPAAGGLPSWAVALGLAVVLAPTLSHTPQNGDGAELVMAALRGGVLHPPGFPLQAWIDRAIAPAAGVHLALAIAALGLLAHAIAAGCIAEVLRRLGAGIFARLLGATAFALFPSVWANAVEPEVFALGHAFVAATLLAAVIGATNRGAKGSMRGAIAIGLLGGLGAATHPIAVTAAPAWLVAAWAALRGGERRGARAAAMLAALVLPALALYLSLPLLRTASVWPDWGALRTPADVLHHALRADYGTFGMSGAEGPGTLSGLVLWCGEALRVWNVALLALVAGAVALFTRRAWRSAALAVFGLALAALALLGRATLPEQSYSAAILVRLGGPAALAGGVMIGLGWQALRERADGRFERAFDALVLVAIAAWLALGWREADASRDRTLELYAQGLAAEMPREAVYVAEGDVECFLGIPTPGGRRFPVASPQMALDYYTRVVAPRLEPRVFHGQAYATWEDVLKECARLGLTVAGASVPTVTLPPTQPELRGLLLVARPGNREVLTRETVAGAVRLAPLAAELPTLPSRGHAFSRFYSLRFARAYAGAGAALRRLGDSTLAVRADSVEAALLHELRAEELATRLRTFIEGARASGY